MQLTANEPSRRGAHPALDSRDTHFLVVGNGKPAQRYHQRTGLSAGVIVSGLDADDWVTQNELKIKRRVLQQLGNTMPKDLKILGKQFKLEALRPANMANQVDDSQLNNLRLTAQYQ